MSGIETTIGLGEEGTYATFAAPTAHYEFVPPESLSRSAERIESQARRPSEYALADTRWEEGRIGVEGDLTFEVLDQGSALLWKHALGSLSTAANATDPAAFDHVATVDSLDGKSLSAQIGRPSLGGIEVFNYVGLKVPSWEVSIEVDGTLSLKLTLDGADELDESAGALAPAVFDDDARLLTWAGGVLELDGVELEAKSYSLQGENAIKTDRYFMRGDGSKVKKEQRRNGLNNYTGSVLVDFETRAMYERYISGAPASLKATFLGRDLGAGTRAGVVIDTPLVRVDGETPTVGDEDIVEQNVPFKALFDRANGVQPVTVTATDALATP